VLKWNQKNAVKLAEHIGRFPTVVIAPQDGSMVTGGSEGRRRFLDALISQYDSLYLDSLVRYHRSILQRNAFLKSERPDIGFLQAMDEQILPLAVRILEARLAFLDLFMPVFQSYYAQLAQLGEQPELRYEAGALPAQFHERWQQAVSADFRAQYTTVGPHRDDLVFELKGHNLKKFASQGQQKTYLVALKLAEHAFLTQKLGTPPVLLLDDVFDKLDPERVRRLLSWANSGEVNQVILTDTGNEHTLKGAIEALMKKYRLQEGLTSHRAADAWKTYAGPFISSRTSKVEFKKGVLKIYIQSAALKQEIHMERTKIKEEMNKILGNGTVEEVQVV
jgi:DNA replication and repair protein RecF